mmetsp:Transcript_42407/g.112234  ORF Transcript_42407/g.112234 Transcript_42407/m.112234 type:complete len:128 (-) Transcript_42407:376-759(-)
MIHKVCAAGGGPPNPCSEQLIELGLAVGSEREQAPGSGRVCEASRRLRESAGEHTLLDAAGIVGMFAAMTIVVDANGHRMPKAMTAVLGPVIKCAQLSRRTRGWLLPGALALLGACVAVAVSRLRGK